MKLIKRNQKKSFFANISTFYNKMFMVLPVEIEAGPVAFEAGSNSQA